MITSEFIKEKARDYCYRVTFSDQSPSQEFYFEDSEYNDNDFDDTKFIQITDDEYKKLFKDYDTSINDQIITNEVPSSTPYTKSSMFKEVVAKSKAGSQVVLPGVNHTTGYGYCHIFKYHMDKGNYTQGYSVRIGGNLKSQFAYAHASDVTMDIVIEVLNATDVLTCEKPKMVRCTKEGYSKTAGSNTKVAIHRGHNWKGYEKYNWVVVSAYPKFR